MNNTAMIMFIFFIVVCLFTTANLKNTLKKLKL